ncbi:hypothetical protein GCM10022407_13360 [Hymenobacter antarcticus]|uniref:Uncharacterized protein n=1 Tax=Hymenobacter antarcticus TaxID=486270 RepID=A0ABP7PPC8_9BACT
MNFVMCLPKYHLLTEQSGRRRAIADPGMAVGQVRRFAHVQVDGVGGKSESRPWLKGRFSFSLARPA